MDQLILFISVPFLFLFSKFVSLPAIFVHPWKGFLDEYLSMACRMFVGMLWIIFLYIVDLY